MIYGLSECFNRCGQNGYMSVMLVGWLMKVDLKLGLPKRAARRTRGTSTRSPIADPPGQCCASAEAEAEAGAEAEAAAAVALDAERLHRERGEKQAKGQARAQAQCGAATVRAEEAMRAACAWSIRSTGRNGRCWRCLQRRKDWLRKWRNNSCRRYYTLDSVPSLNIPLGCM